MSVALATVLVHKGLTEGRLGKRMTAEEEQPMAETLVLTTVSPALVHTYLAVERSLVVRCKAMDLVGSVVA